jgi:hypothetical protein
VSNHRIQTRNHARTCRVEAGHPRNIGTHGLMSGRIWIEGESDECEDYQRQWAVAQRALR